MDPVPWCPGLVFDWPGGDACNPFRAEFVAWVASLGLDPERLADRAAVVADIQGNCYLHVDEIYRSAEGGDAGDPLDWDRLLTKRHIIAVDPDSLPTGIVEKRLVTS